MSISVVYIRGYIRNQNNFTVCLKDNDVYNLSYSRPAGQPAVGPKGKGSDRAIDRYSDNNLPAEPCSQPLTLFARPWLSRRKCNCYTAVHN
jgi:hypothetical protein